MTRKSKQPGGNFPLTHYERTQKFASSEYGTTAQRLAGHSQYQWGMCGLSLTKFTSNNNNMNDDVVCTPSGYLYRNEAILDYLLTQTQELKEQRIAYELQQQKQQDKKNNEQIDKQMKQFEEMQQTLVSDSGRKRKTLEDEKEVARKELLRSSYWLAEAQPERVEPVIVEPPPERPLSPNSQQPLRRKDILPVTLKWDEDKNIVCEVSDKTIHVQPATAYWVDKKQSGRVILTSVYEQFIQETNVCPITNKKIKLLRSLQQSGSSFASSSQSVQVKKYRPTIT